jgi:DNA-binding response OmpR family regulator
MVQAMNDNPLSGVRVLVVEDDTLLAMDLKETLVDAGAIVVDVCQTLEEGMARANDNDFAVAVLDFSLGPNTVSPLARRLVRRGLPFILYTGRPRSEPSLAEWSDRPIVEKPAPSRVLVSALKDAMAR